MKTLHTEITLTFDDARVSEQEIRNRLDAMLQGAFTEAEGVQARWEMSAASSAVPDAHETGTTLAGALERIARLSASLMWADDLSAMLMTYIEEAPTVRESDAGTLAEEIRVEVGKMGAIENEETVRAEIAGLIDALEEVAGGRA
jgi:hypothetical protein